MESRDGERDPFDGVYSRVSSISLRLETNALLFTRSLLTR
jgi:hypothetical protein